MLAKSPRQSRNVLVWIRARKRLTLLLLLLFTVMLGFIYHAHHQQATYQSLAMLRTQSRELISAGRSRVDALTKHYNQLNQQLQEYQQAYPFNSVVMVGFKFSTDKVTTEHDWTLGLPRYIAQYAQDVYVLQITMKGNLKLGRVLPEHTIRKEPQELFDRLEQNPFDLLIFRQVTLIPAVKQRAPAVFYNTRFASLIPIMPGNKAGWSLKDIEEKFPWFNVYIPDMSFLKPPHPASIWPSKGEVAARSPKQELVFVGSISERKGQAELARILPDNFPAKIWFMGMLREPEILNLTKGILDQKKIDYEYVGLVDWDELQSYYKRADGIVLFSQSDPSPRVIFEGLVYNLPFLISSTVSLPPILLDSSMNLGVVCDLSAPQATVQKQLHTFLNTDHGYAPFEFAQKYLSEDTVYGSLLQQIADKYTEKQAIQQMPYYPNPRQ